MAVQLFDLGKQVEVIPVDAKKIPYAFMIKLYDKTYKFTFRYNNTGGFFTVDLENSMGKPLVYGEVLRYGRRLFAPIETEEFPLPVIIPLCLNGNISTITTENFGSLVKLYLYMREAIS